MIAVLASCVGLLGDMASAEKPSIADNFGLYFEHKTVIIPGDDKKHRGGEDSADANETLLVVADGVGGWAMSGVNPGLFSKKLTHDAILFYEESDG